MLLSCRLGIPGRFRCQRPGIGVAGAVELGAACPLEIMADPQRVIMTPFDDDEGVLNDFESVKRGISGLGDIVDRNPDRREALLCLLLDFCGVELACAVGSNCPSGAVSVPAGVDAAAPGVAPGCAAA